MRFWETAHLLLPSPKPTLTLTWGKLYVIISFTSTEVNDGVLRDQGLWARETEHRTQTLVSTKTAGRQPGWGHCYLRSYVL